MCLRESYWGNQITIPLQPPRVKKYNSLKFVYIEVSQNNGAVLNVYYNVTRRIQKYMLVQLYQVAQVSFLYIH